MPMPASYSPPSSDTEHEDITSSLMPTTKRRTNGTNNTTNNAPSANPGKPLLISANLPPLPPVIHSFVAGRRRRLFAYLAAFAIMLALSSMLDLRRAALNAKKDNSRIKLSLPPSADSSSEVSSEPANGAIIASSIANRTNAHSGNEQHITANPETPPSPAKSHHILHDHTSLLHDAGDSPDGNPTKKQKLSPQEMEDGVQELISHVEAESTVNNTVAHDANSTDSSSTDSISHSHGATGDSHSSPLTIGASKLTHNSTPAPVSNTTVEEQFSVAQSLLESITGNAILKPFLDAEELRTLQALALQGVRGDCEKANDPNAGGGLFKTDIEAAASEIEKTDPLWGAWCVFSGRYRSECMRDYVARIHNLHARITAAAETAATAGDSTTSTSSASAGIAIGINIAENFDENAATLDDVLTPEAQNILRKRAEKVLPHLSENDVRLLSALALQASLGDCSPYAQAMKLRKKLENEIKEHEHDTSVDGSSNVQSAKDHPILKHPPRELVEPLFGNKATRAEGALWGAWCVFARRKRSIAASSLTDRVDGFWGQLIVQTTAKKIETEEDENAVGGDAAVESDANKR